MLADLDVAIKTNMRMGRGLVEDCGHGLDLQVVGRHSCAHQAKGRGYAIEQVNLNAEIGLLE